MATSFRSAEEQESTAFRAAAAAAAAPPPPSRCSSLLKGGLVLGKKAVNNVAVSPRNNPLGVTVSAHVRNIQSDPSQN